MKIITKKRLLIFLIFLLVYLLVIIGIFYSEKDSGNFDNIWDVFWYSLVTLTSVGYGDVYPVTSNGKILGLVFVLASLAVVGLLISQFTYQIEIYMENKKYGQNGIKLSGHTIVFGLNKFSANVVKEIANVGKEVVVVSDNKDDIDLLLSRSDIELKLHVFFCDYSNYEDLQKVSIKDASTIFVSFDEDTESLVHILNMKKLFGDLTIVIDLGNSLLKETFVNAGVDFAISPQDIASKLIASFVFEPHAAQITEDLMSSSDLSGAFDLQEYRIVKENPLIGLSYKKAFYEIKDNLNSILLGIYKNNENKLYKNPDNEIYVNEDDRLIFVADIDRISEIEDYFKIQQGNY